MKKSAIIFLSALLISTTSFPLWANYEKGLQAFQQHKYKTAYKEWEKLAKKGNASIQSTIAVMYHTGVGVEKNYKKAFYWYKKAAEQGLTAAQANLGVMYAKGTGTKQDYVQSYAWYSLAASTLSIKKVGSALWGIDYLATKMTPEQLKKAKALTKEYETRFVKKKKQ